MGFAFPRKKKKSGADIVRHFNIRCIERIGIALPQDELKRRLVNHTLEFVRKESNMRTHWRIPKDLLPKGHTRDMVAVYDKSRHHFVTVLFNDGGSFYDTEMFD